MLLLQPFLSVVDYGNQRVKGPMLEKLAAITPQLAQTKPMLVTRQILPLAFRLLDEFKVDVRQNNTVCPVLQSRSHALFTPCDALLAVTAEAYTEGCLFDLRERNISLQFRGSMVGYYFGSCDLCE